MSETKNILDIMEARLLTDTTLRAWTLAELGKVHNVFVGLDPDNLPGKQYYPIVTLHNLVRVGRGAASNRHTYALELGAGVYDKGITKSGTPGDGESIKLNGFVLVEALRDMAETALYREGLNQKWKVDTSGETLSDDDGAFFKSASLLTIELIAGSTKPLHKSTEQ